MSESGQLEQVLTETEIVDGVAVDPSQAQPPVVDFDNPEAVAAAKAQMRPEEQKILDRWGEQHRKNKADLESMRKERDEALAKAQTAEEVKQIAARSDLELLKSDVLSSMGKPTSLRQLITATTEEGIKAQIEMMEGAFRQPQAAAPTVTAPSPVGDVQAQAAAVVPPVDHRPQPVTPPDGMSSAKLHALKDQDPDAAMKLVEGLLAQGVTTIN